MVRYPQAIPSKFGEKCPYCTRKKASRSRTCMFCDPAFKSFSRAQQWAAEHADGPCVLAYRQHRYEYTEWPRRAEAK